MKLGDAKDALEIIGIIGGLFISGGAVTVWWKRTTNQTSIDELKDQVVKLNATIKELNDKIVVLEKANSEMIAVIDMTSKMVKDDADIAQKLYEYVNKNNG